MGVSYTNMFFFIVHSQLKLVSLWDAYMKMLIVYSRLLNLGDWEIDHMSVKRPQRCIQNGWPSLLILTNSWYIAPLQVSNKNKQILAGHVSVQHAFVVILTYCTTNLTIP
jgi:hypothetical protein